MTVITNGNYETRESIDQGLEHCDMVSMARALIANPGAGQSSISTTTRMCPRRSAARAAIAVSAALPPARSVATTFRASAARIRACSARS